MAQSRTTRRRRPGIVVRAFEPADAGPIAQLRARADVAAGGLRAPFQSVADTQEQLLTRRADERMLVAEIEGRPVALGKVRSTARPMRRHVAEMEMTIDPRAGDDRLGPALLDALIGLAEKWLGVLRIELKVWADDDKALALYRERGFAIEGVARSYGLRDGKLVDCFYMARVAEKTPWPKLTAEEASRRTPPQLTSGAPAKKKGNGNGNGHGPGGMGWGFGLD